MTVCRRGCRVTQPYGNHFSKKNLALLGALCHGDKKHRTAIVRTADKPLVKCICECLLNVLQGVVKLRDNTKRKLRRHKYALRKLNGSDRMGNADWRNKKRAIVQSGGSFLPLLLAPILGTLISKIFGSDGTR